MIETLCEKYKIVDATAGPVTTNGGVVGRYVSLKNVNYAWLLLQFTNPAAFATVITIQEATAVAPVGAVTITNTVEIWSNILGSALSDTLIRRAAATTYTIAGANVRQTVLFGINPARLQPGFDVLGFLVATGGGATSFVCGSYFLDYRYQSETPPVAITD